MKKMMGLAVLAIGLLTLPCAAYAGMLYTDILVTPQVPSAFFGGVAGGDGNPGGLGIDWGIGNTVPFQSVTDDMVFSTCTGDFMVGSNWKERMRITKDGNVGIGTTTPLYKLHVDNQSTSGRIASFSTSAAGADAELLIVNSGDSDINTIIELAATQSTRYGGKIVFGRENGENWAKNYNYADGFISLNPVLNGNDPINNEAMRVTSSGNVGIGKTDPSEKLEVNGNVLADQFLTGDIIFRKDDKPVWRMYEDEKGLYVQSLTTEKKYALVFEELRETKTAIAGGQDLKAENQSLKAKVNALEARLAKLEALFSKGN